MLDITKEALVKSLVELVQSVRVKIEKRDATTEMWKQKILEAKTALGLEPGCTEKDARKRYRELVKDVHPDLNLTRCCKEVYGVYRRISFA